MEVNFVVTYNEKVASVDLPKIDGGVKARLKQAIEQKLATSPLHFGIPLRKSLKGYLKLRVGNYRIIFKMVTSKKEVRILGIMHRSVVYGQIKKRI